MGKDGFFCDYVIHTLLLDSQLGATTEDRAKLLATGGLKIYTTLSPAGPGRGDQRGQLRAARRVPRPTTPRTTPTPRSLIQPGTGKMLAIAEDRPYGTGTGPDRGGLRGQPQYGGGAGVQTGSSSKLFTLMTALEQGMPFGFQLTVPGSRHGHRLLQLRGPAVGTTRLASPASSS